MAEGRVSLTVFLLAIDNNLFLVWLFFLLAAGGAGFGGEGGGREGEKGNGHVFHGEEILGDDEKETQKEKDHR